MNMISDFNRYMVGLKLIAEHYNVTQWDCRNEFVVQGDSYIPESLRSTLLDYGFSVKGGRCNFRFWL